MSVNRLLVDDPRLTAYALGELDPAQAAEIEELLRQHPAAQSIVEETRELAGLLSTQLAAEPAPRLSDAQRNAITLAAAGHLPDAAIVQSTTNTHDGRQQVFVPSSEAIDLGKPHSLASTSSTVTRSTDSRWMGRFASLVTIAATILVTVSLLPRDSAPVGVNEPLTRADLAGDVDGDQVAQLSGSASRVPAQFRQPLAEGARDHWFDAERLGEANGTAILSDGSVSLDSQVPSRAEDRTEFLFGERPASRAARNSPVDQPVGAPRAGRDESAGGQLGGQRYFTGGAGGGTAALGMPAEQAGEPAGEFRESDERAAPDDFAARGGPARKPADRRMSGKMLSKSGQPQPQKHPAWPEMIDEAGFPVTGPTADAPGIDRRILSGSGKGSGSDTSSPSFNKNRSGMSRQSVVNRERHAKEEAESVSEHLSSSTNETRLERGKQRGTAVSSSPAPAAAARGVAADRIEPALETEKKAKAVGDLVTRYNDLYDQKRYAEAEVLGREMQRLDPKNPVGDVMRLKSKMAAKEGANKSLREKNPKALTDSINDVDRASVAVTDDIQYPDAKKWKELTERGRKKYLEKWERMSPEERAVEQSLSKEVSVHFDNTRVVDVLQDLESQLETEIRLDAATFEKSNLGESTVTVHLDGVRAESALSLLLQPLQLGYTVREGKLTIAASAPAVEPPGTEAYTPIVENLFIAPLAEPLSTFSVDVDTASYSNVRRFLTHGQMPPPNAVRVEELVNYFSYDIPAPPAEGQPFAVQVETGPAPWRLEHRLVRVALKGREIAADKRPASNLVFLVDVSGSMADQKKLPLVKTGLKLLTEQMTEGDRVAIVTYSDTATLRLDSTPGNQQKPILDTIASLQAAGSTNGAGGIQLAYRTAIEHFVDGGTNRVILCTDGDFNVGVSDDDELVKLIEDRARSKVFFSVFGFGMGNLKDGKLEKLADKGNGHYAYIDDLPEAKRMFVDELAGTLVTIAKDVKVQVEFNPTRVGAYRLIGYENRALANRDFENDKKDAGDIGAGHRVTALYEIAPAPKLVKTPQSEALRYQRFDLAAEGNLAGELLTVRLRYKQPEGDTSSLIEVPVNDVLPGANDPEDLRRKLAENSPPRPSRDFEWAASVAAFGMVLRDSQFRGQAGLDMVLELAQGAKGEDPKGQRQEFIELVQRARELRPNLQSSPGAAPAVSADDTAHPAVPNAAEGEQRAAVDGKYQNLLRILPAEGDREQYGLFHDYGRWEGNSYQGRENLPQGYWVYVYPNWYLWGDLAPGGVPK